MAYWCSCGSYVTDRSMHIFYHPGCKGWVPGNTTAAGDDENAED